jgi:hypothetical protein
MPSGLPPPGPILWAAALVGDGKYAQAVFFDAINDGVGVAMNDEAACLPCCGRSQIRMFCNQLQTMHDFVSEVSCATLPGLFGVPASRFSKLLLCSGIERDIHRDRAAISASISLKTSSAGIHCVRPASMSATRRAISSSQACAMASGESSGIPSRLAIRRWMSSLRSCGVSCKAWSSRSFNRAAMMFSRNDALLDMVAPAT